MQHRWLGLIAALAGGLALAAAPAVPAAAAPAFQPPKIAGPKPWTAKPFDDSPDNLSFAVVTDLYSGYRKGVFEVAAAELGLLHPAFITTIGDQIEGGRRQGKLNAQWDEFDARWPRPALFMGGNHDLTSSAAGLGGPWRRYTFRSGVPSGAGHRGLSPRRCSRSSRCATCHPPRRPGLPRRRKLPTPAYGGQGRRDQP